MPKQLTAVQVTTYIEEEAEAALTISKPPPQRKTWMPVPPKGSSRPQRRSRIGLPNTTVALAPRGCVLLSCTFPVLCFGIGMNSHIGLPNMTAPGLGRIGLPNTTGRRERGHFFRSVLRHWSRPHRFTQYDCSRTSRVVGLPNNSVLVQLGPIRPTLKLFVERLVLRLDL